MDKAIEPKGLGRTEECNKCKATGSTDGGVTLTCHICQGWGWVKPVKGE